MPKQTKARRLKLRALTLSVVMANYSSTTARTSLNSGALEHLDDRLGLHDHLRFIEEMEALHQKLVAAAFDVQDTKACTFFGCRGRLRGNQLTAIRVGHDRVLGGAIERLG